MAEWTCSSSTWTTKATSAMPAVIRRELSRVDRAGGRMGALHHIRQTGHSWQLQISCGRLGSRFASFFAVLFPRRRCISHSLTDRMQAQTQLFYTGGDLRLLGTNMNDRSDPRIVEDSINSAAYTTSRESSLAAYWPWLVCQSVSGGLVHVRNNPPANLDPGAAWGAADINITALGGTKLAMVPVSTNYTRIASRGGYAVFYQGIDSRLSVAITHLSELDSTYVQSWPTSAFPCPPPPPVKEAHLINGCLYFRFAIHHHSKTRCHGRLLRLPTSRHPAAS